MHENWAGGNDRQIGRRGREVRPAPARSPLPNGLLLARPWKLSSKRAMSL